ncbi:MAG: Lrp/AsnC family transcriptional regulator, partial [Candidatus Thorarchaeota archaeon]
RGNHQAVTKKETLLTLRECVRSAPATMASILRITRQAARQRIQILENNETVTGYIPIVRPDTFGEPVLLQVKIDTSQYKLQEDLGATIASIREFLQSGVGHAPLSTYVYHDEKSGSWNIHCVTMTNDTEGMVEKLYREENIARENIDIVPLTHVDGVPMYGNLSLAAKE